MIHTASYTVKGRNSLSLTGREISTFTSLGVAMDTQIVRSKRRSSGKLLRVHKLLIVVNVIILLYTWVCLYMSTSHESQTRVSSTRAAEQKSSRTSSEKQNSHNVTVSSSRKTNSLSPVEDISNEDLAKFRVLNVTEVNTFMLLLDAFTMAMKQADVPFFLFGGTLLGSWRHHGLVPWDDDMDVILPSADRSVAEQALRNLAPVFSVTTGTRMKLYSKQFSSTWAGWSWPFLDISFYMENATHIWDLDSRHFEEFIYNKDDVFPLTRRPFQGRLLPAPRNTLSVLRQNYDVDMCKTNWYSHKYEEGIRRKHRAEARCDTLKRFFPFVVRTPRPRDEDGCLEILQKNGTTLSCCFLDRTSKEC